MIAAVSVLMAAVHLGIWFLGAWLGRRSAGLVRRSVYFMLGPALVFSPAVLIGEHGGFPFPAIAALVIQPTVAPGLKVASFFSVYLVFILLRVLIVLAIRVKNKARPSQAPSGAKADA
jgi:hypothetical protein